MFSLKNPCYKFLSDYITCVQMKNDCGMYFKKLHKCNELQSHIKKNFSENNHGCPMSYKHIAPLQKNNH